MPLRFQNIKMKKNQHLNISADSTDWLCTTNPPNWRKIENTSNY